MSEAAISKGQCPECGQRGFVIGPGVSGGIRPTLLQFNIECANLACRERFNAAFFGGEAMFCQRIGNGRDGPAWPSEPRN